MSRKEKESKGYGFGTFAGVFTPSILTIIGVVMYLRFGWMLGNVGLGIGDHPPSVHFGGSRGRG